MQTLAANDFIIVKKPIFFSISLAAALLGFITPFLVIFGRAIWNSVDPLPVIDPVYDEGPMMSYEAARTVESLLYGFIWWLTMEILGGAFALVGFLRRENGWSKICAIGIIALNIVVPVLLVSLYFILLK